MAKAAAAEKNPKRKGSARARLRARRKARSNPAGGGGGARANPPVLADLTHVVLPGFGTYAATRFLQRIAYTVALKRWPRAAKHVYALAGVAVFGGSWLLAHRFKQVAKYHDGILVGSGIAAAQGVAQSYLPKYAWMASDVTGAGAPALNANGTAPEMLEPAGDEYSMYEDEVEPARTVKAPRARGAKPMAATLQMAAQAAGDSPGSGVDDDIMSELDDGEDLDDLGGGIFDGGSLSN